MTGSRFSDSQFSSLSRVSFAASPPLNGRDNGFISMETHSAGRRDDLTMERPFCRPLEIICLPSNSAGSLSKSDISSTVASHHAQEATNGTSYRMFNAEPRVSFADVPTAAYCTSCGTQVLTYTEYRVSNTSWAVAGLLCAFGCHLGCCLAPFFSKSFKDVIHLCPLCKTQLGSYAKE